MKRSNISKRNLINLAVLLIFILLCFIMISRHENWRDEAQSWNLARDLDIIGLFRQMKYEGHPCLWHLILMPFAKLGFPYLTMNLISTFFVVVSVGLLLWKSPMHILVKILAVFGCAFWYDYAVIARSYCLIPVILFLMAIVYPKRYLKPFQYGLCLAALVQTHVIMLPFAGISSVFFMLEAFCRFRKDKDYRALFAKGAGLCLPLFSLILFILQISGAPAVSGLKFGPFTLFQFVYGIYHGFVGYWAPILGQNQRLGILVIALTMVCFFAVHKEKDCEKRKALAIVVLSLTIQIIFSITIYGYSRQRYLTWIFIWIWLLWVCWTPQKRSTFQRSATAVFVILSIISYAGCFTAFSDISQKYSGGEECAEYINAFIPSDAVVLQTNTTRFTALAPYLDKEIKVYSTDSCTTETFKTWGVSHNCLNNINEVVAWVHNHSPNAEDFWLIVPHPDFGEYGNIQIQSWCEEQGKDYLVFNNYLTCLFDDEYAIYKIPTVI